MAIRNQYTVKAGTTIELIGITYPKLKEFIESKFTDGMTWAKVLSAEIHLDHIMPVSSFNLTDARQARMAFHYTNLQPLWAKENLRKNAKKPIQHQPLLMFSNP